MVLISFLSVFLLRPADVHLTSEHRTGGLIFDLQLPVGLWVNQYFWSLICFYEAFKLLFSTILYCATWQDVFCGYFLYCYLYILYNRLLGVVYKKKKTDHSLYLYTPQTFTSHYTNVLISTCVQSNFTLHFAPTIPAWRILSDLWLLIREVHHTVDHMITKACAFIWKPAKLKTCFPAVDTWSVLTLCAKTVTRTLRLFRGAFLYTYCITSQGFIIQMLPVD